MPRTTNKEIRTAGNVEASFVSNVSKLAEKSSSKLTIPSGETRDFSLEEEETAIEVYVESGSVRVRTDGELATSSSGAPLGAGYMDSYSAKSISIFAENGAEVTVVKR